MVKIPHAFIPVVFALAFVCARAQSDPFDLDAKGTREDGVRVWTSAVGTVVQARLKGCVGNMVRLETVDGKSLEVNVEALSRADQDFLKTQSVASSSQTGLSSSPASLPIPSRRPAPDVPRTLPKDESIEKIPMLKRMSTQPVSFSFYDIVRGRTVTNAEFKGKYVYVHSLYFRENMGEVLRELKLLHDKYGPRGFEILTIQSYVSRNSPAHEDSYEDKAMRVMIRRAIEDYGIDWYISYPPKPGRNPLIGKFADSNYFDWLLDDQTRLIHTNVDTSATIHTSASLAAPTPRLRLSTALQTLFPDNG